MDKTDYNMLVGANETTHGNCPKCNHCFDNGDIPKESHEHYSAPFKWSSKIGIELQGVYDGVLHWQCPECGFTWHRFTGLIIADALAANLQDQHQQVSPTA